MRDQPPEEAMHALGQLLLRIGVDESDTDWESLAGLGDVDVHVQIWRGESSRPVREPDLRLLSRPEFRLVQSNGKPRNWREVLDNDGNESRKIVANRHHLRATRGGAHRDALFIGGDFL